MRLSAKLFVESGCLWLTQRKVCVTIAGKPAPPVPLSAALSKEAGKLIAGVAPKGFV